METDGWRDKKKHAVGIDRGQSERDGGPAGLSVTCYYKLLHMYMILLCPFT